MLEFLSRCSTRMLFAMAAAVVFLTYLPSGHYGFVGLDDPEYILENDHVRTGLSASNVWWAVTSCGYASNWHPLAWMSLQADVEIAARTGLEKRPGPVVLTGIPDELPGLARTMHLHNVAVHVLNAILLMVLILRLTGNRFAAVVFALLWAIHPLRTEVVCWVTERKELSCVFFMLLSLLCWTGGRKPSNSQTLKLSNSQTLNLLFFSLALLAKPLAVTLPCLLFAWDWVARKRPFSRCLVRTLPFFALSLGVGVLTLLSQDEAMGVGARFTVVERLIMTVNAPIIYLRQTVWPAGLTSFYTTRPPLHLPETILGLALLGFMAWVTVRWIRRREGWAGACVLGVVWCYIGLLPMLGIVKVGDQSHSDRYTYWVGCGAATLAAWAVTRAMQTDVFRRRWRPAWWRQVAWGVAGVLAIAVLLTSLRMPVWRNRIVHYRDGALKNWVEAPVCCYTRELRKRGAEGTAEAERILREAIMHNDVAELRAELAHLVACSARPTPMWRPDEGIDPAFVEAKLDAESAIRANPEENRAYEALGIVYLRNGRWEKAKENLLRAREIMVKVRAAASDIANVDMLLELCEKKEGANVPQ